MADPILAAMRAHYKIDPTEISAAITALDGLGETTISARYANFLDLITTVFDDSLRESCLSSDICFQAQSGRKFSCRRNWKENSVGEEFEIVNDHSGERMFAVQDNTDLLYYLLRQHLFNLQFKWFIFFGSGTPTEDIDYYDNEYDAAWPLAGDDKGQASIGFVPADADSTTADFTQPNLALPLGDVSKDLVSGSIESPVDLFLHYLETSVTYDADEDAEILLEVSRDGGSSWDPVLQEIVTGQGVAESQGVVPYEYHTVLQWRISASTDGVVTPSTTVSLSDVQLRWNSMYPLIQSFG